MRGAAAGALAAAAWNAYDPILGRIFGTPYGDSKVLGPFVTQGQYEWLANLVTHTAGGAAFGFLFERLGGRTAKHGVVAAVAENTLLWPAVAVVGRFHPKRQSGEWPPLLLDARAFGAGTAGHALFGLLLGLGVSESRSPARQPAWTKPGQSPSPARTATSAARWPRSSPAVGTRSGR